MGLKIIILVLLVAIVISLFSSLLFLVKDDSQSHRTVNMLFVRVGLAVLLILTLMYGFYSGQLGMTPPWVPR